MTTYLVECYWPGVDAERLAETVDRLAVAESHRDGVRWISSTLIPDDEIVLCLAEGSAAEAVRASAHAAGLPAERVVAAITVAVTDPHRMRKEL